MATKTAKKPSERKSPSRAKVVSVAAVALKLRIEKVPEPLWKKNLRSDEFGLGRYRWDRLRKEVLHASGPGCVICGDTEKPQCHEVWEYQESEKDPCVAKLLKLEIVCRRCHFVHHWGNTLDLFARGEINREAVEALQAHFQHVNRCTEKEFHSHVIATSHEWRVRSAKEWTIDWGEFDALVKQAAAARDARKA